MQAPYAALYDSLLDLHGIQELTGGNNPQAYVEANGIVLRFIVADALNNSAKIVQVDGLPTTEEVIGVYFAELLEPVRSVYSAQQWIEENAGGLSKDPNGPAWGVAKAIAFPGEPDFCPEEWRATALSTNDAAVYASQAESTASALRRKQSTNGGNENPPTNSSRIRRWLGRFGLGSGHR